jgi:hypothetical protein
MLEQNQKLSNLFNSSVFNASRMRLSLEPHCRDGEGLVQVGEHLSIQECPGTCQEVGSGVVVLECNAVMLFVNVEMRC